MMTLWLLWRQTPTTKTERWVFGFRRHHRRFNRSRRSSRRRRELVLSFWRGEDDSIIKNPPWSSRESSLLHRRLRFERGRGGDRGGWNRVVHSRVYIFCLLAKVSLWQSKKTFQKKKMRDFYATSSKCQASVFLSQSKSSEYRSVGATMRTTNDNNNDDAKKKKKKKKPLLRRRRRDKRSRFSLFYALFVVVFSSSLFFFFFDESNERMRSFAGEDADATKMISFVSFPVVLVEAAADTAQEAEKRSTSGQHRQVRSHQDQNHNALRI